MNNSTVNTCPGRWGGGTGAGVADGGRRATGAGSPLEARAADSAGLIAGPVTAAERDADYSATVTASARRAKRGHWPTESAPELELPINRYTNQLELSVN